MRVVLDTNILVSACWKPDGLEARVVELARSGALTACVTAEVLAEYRDVLGRKKLASVKALSDELLSWMERSALLVEAGERVTVASDDDDNRLLECAFAAGAAYLITGNLKHYPEVWSDIRMVNARQFLETHFGLEPRA